MSLSSYVLFVLLVLWIVGYGWPQFVSRCLLCGYLTFGVPIDNDFDFVVRLILIMNVMVWEGVKQWDVKWKKK